VRRHARQTITCVSARANVSYLAVVRVRKSVSALRSSGDPMRCSGIFVPGVYPTKDAAERKARPMLRPVAGTKLIREWQGIEHCVTVRAND
jgi:hypothetical protein